MSRGRFGGLSSVSGAGISLRSILVTVDSLSDYYNSGLVASSATVVDLGGGFYRAVRNAHLLGLGDPIRMSVGPVGNTTSAVVTKVIDGNTFEYQAIGPTTTVTGGAPIILFGYRTSGSGWPTWLENALGYTLQKTWAAAAGATFAQSTDILRKLPPGNEDMAFVMGGMNNIYINVGQPLSQIQAEFLEHIAEVKRRAGKVCVFSVPARLSSDPVWTAGKQAIHTAFNRWLYAQCAANGWAFVDTWAATQGGATYVDATATNPDPLASMVRDNTHPSHRGAKGIGDAAWEKTKQWFGVGAWKAPHSSAIGSDAGNLLSNATFATDTAGVATGWSISNATASMKAVGTMANRTVASDGDAAGRKQVLTLAKGTAGGATDMRFRRDNIQALLTAGVNYQLSVQFKVTGAVGLVGLELAMTGTRANGTFFWVIGNGQDSNTGALVGDFSGTLMTPIAKCPPDLTDLDIWVRAYLDTNQTTDLVLELWQPRLAAVA